MDERHEHGQENQPHEWPQLEAMREHLGNLPFPQGIDEAIRQGMSRAKQRRRRRKLVRLCAYSACTLLIVIVLSVRFSPAVAAFVKEIPVLGSIVELIQYDKGLQLALENDFMQKVSLYEDIDGIKVTIDGVVADESRVMIFYTLTNMDGRKGAVYLDEAKIVNSGDIQYGLSYGNSGFDEVWELKQGSIDMNLQEGTQLPNHLELEMKLSPYDKSVKQGDAVYHFNIPIDKEKFEGMYETIAINKTVTVEGQHITFGEMTVYPTRIGIEVEYDAANTKKLFYFDDIRLVDEKGEAFGTIMNGVSASQIDENRTILYFQSNYFLKPKELYLRARSIRALDKSKLEVRVDLDEMKLLSRPDSLLSLESTSKRELWNERGLIFNLRNDEMRSYNLFKNSYTDATGQTFESNRSESSNEYYQYFIEKVEQQSPITLTIEDYPARIYGDVNIQIR
ncbi:MAG: DUF4179 domain-containing protein [Candidatus Cohnella colombiensis]|uniref:DUF4179 domain-containing protein n=1 Tax=Candidatus Cohnella colombiensis TaxID=3121368 RepID=A0AA95JFP9_9BACL|nr:MAG: DUF4179 domain-containing protein [Cohnella sp.]